MLEFLSDRVTGILGKKEILRTISDPAISKRISNPPRRTARWSVSRDGRVPTRQICQTWQTLLDLLDLPDVPKFRQICQVLTILQGLFSASWQSQLWQSFRQLLDQRCQDLPDLMKIIPKSKTKRHLTLTIFGKCSTTFHIDIENEQARSQNMSNKLLS